MGAITGANTDAILKIGSVFGTAVSGTTGDRLTFEGLNRAQNPNILMASPKGSGLDMQDNATVGAIAPTVGIEALEHFNNAIVAGQALFFGADSVMNMGSGYYCHSLLYEPTRLSKFATIAFEGASDKVFEYPSCTPTRVAANYDAPPNYGRVSIDFLADNEKIADTTNTNASMAGSTVADSTRVIAKPQDYFLINARTGSALSTSTDSVAVTAVEIEYSHECEFIPEIKGSTGNGQPISSGDVPFAVTMTVTFKNAADFTWFTAQSAGTEYKAELQITDSGGAYYVKRAFPCLKVLQDPSYNVTAGGMNPLSVTFQALVVTAAPAGMISGFPYAIYKNTKATSYLA